MFFHLFFYCENIFNGSIKNFGNFPSENKRWIISAFLKISYSLAPHTDLLGKFFLFHIKLRTIFLNSVLNHC